MLTAGMWINGIMAFYQLSWIGESSLAFPLMLIFGSLAYLFYYLADPITE